MGCAVDWKESINLDVFAALLLIYLARGPRGQRQIRETAQILLSENLCQDDREMAHRVLRELLGLPNGDKEHDSASSI